MSDQAIDRTRLPIRRPLFSGVANETLGGSEPGWEQIGHVKPPERAPNVLVVLIDDAGFGNPGTFGGPIDTPNYDRVAGEGLRYSRFHVTAMCSPTRAALLTGRNHHAVGMGGIPEFSGGFPGYSAMLPKDAAPFPKVVKENGYSTAAVGKWHLTPEKEQGPAGPFDHWPNAWGFDYYYWGFLAPEAGQFDTMIAENQKFIGVQEGKDGKPFYFPEAMTDQAIDWLHGVRGHDSEKPWCLYYSTGCSHAPHHVWKEWAEKYKGRFDQGWDKLREETFERQKKLGVVPADAILTPRDELMPAWDSLDENSKRLFARQMEVYAGYSENADHHVGRLLDSIEAMGELDDTIVIWIWGDNGASLEGTPTGTFNEGTMVNGPRDPDSCRAHPERHPRALPPRDSTSGSHTRARCFAGEERSRRLSAPLALASCGTTVSVRLSAYFYAMFQLGQHVQLGPCGMFKGVEVMGARLPPSTASSD